MTKQQAPEPFGYYVEHTLAEPAFLRAPSYIPHGEPNYRVTPLYAATLTVADIPDLELLGRAVANCRARHSGKSPRWVGVSDTFVLGSTYSMQLCRRFCVDPHEMVGRRR